MSTERTSQSEANKNKDKLEQSHGKDPKSTEFGKTNDPSFDPSHQNSGIDAGKPSNPNTPTIRNMDQDEGNLHPAIGDDDRIKSSGRRIHGGPNEPLVSINPTSGGSQSKSEPEQVANAVESLLDGNTEDPQYNDLEVGDGLLIAVEPNKTIDQTVFEAHKRVHQLNEYWSVPYLNEEGEEVSEVIIVHELKRNDDKSIQLGDKGKPVTGANQTHIKKRIQIRQYAVKPVTAGDKFSNDGALIIRVF